MNLRKAIFNNNLLTSMKALQELDVSIEALLPKVKAALAECKKRGDAGVYSIEGVEDNLQDLEVARRKDDHYKMLILFNFLEDFPK